MINIDENYLTMLRIHARYYDFIKNENERRKEWNEKNPNETQLKDLVVYSPYDFDVVSKDFIIN